MRKERAKRALGKTLLERDKVQAQLGSSVTVYECPSQGYRAQTLFDLILGDISPESLCKKKPTGVRCNASFIIDLESVALKDLQLMIMVPGFLHIHVDHML